MHESIFIYVYKPLLKNVHIPLDLLPKQIFLLRNHNFMSLNYFSLLKNSILSD